MPWFKTIWGRVWAGCHRVLGAVVFDPANQQAVPADKVRLYIAHQGYATLLERRIARDCSTDAKSEGLLRQAVHAYFASQAGRHPQARRAGSPPLTPSAPAGPPRPAPRRAPSPASLSSADEEALRRLRGMLARREVTSGFADSVLRQWEETGQVTPSQVERVRQLVARVRSRASTPRIVGGGGRKPGSHRSNW
jgi:hypothetical protein